MKQFRCDQCNREFKTPMARAQHKRDKHGAVKPQGLSKEAALVVMDDMDDLPDGAFFAMAQDLGLSSEDFLDEEVIGISNATASREEESHKCSWFECDCRPPRHGGG